MATLDDLLKFLRIDKKKVDEVRQKSRAFLQQPVPEKLQPAAKAIIDLKTFLDSSPIATPSNIAKEYGENRIAKPILKAKEDFSKPGAVNKGLGALSILGAGFSLTPAGVPWAGFDALKNVLGTVRKGTTPDKAIEAARSGFTGKKYESLGGALTDNPALSSVLNIGEFAGPAAGGIVRSLASKNAAKTLNDLVKQGKALGFDGLSPRAFSIHPEDRKALIDIVGKLEGKIKLDPKENNTLQMLADHYLGQRYSLGSTKKIAQAFDFVLAKQMGGIAGKLPKPAFFNQEASGPITGKVSEQAMQRLDDLVNYPKKLLQRGYTRKQIDTISATKARELLSKGIDPLEYSRTQGVLDKLPASELQATLNRPEIKVSQKVNLLDYYRTPQNVLKKIGLEKEGEFLKQKYDDYLKELPVEIGKITAWSKEAKSPASSQRIFQWLDGDKIQLDQTELKVANEIKSYLSSWADKLRIPKDKRITNYITRIFDKGEIEKEFDPDLAKAIADRVPGSVYDPFLLKRSGKQGYKEDVWQALDAYVKRATRKYHMDPALEPLKMAADKLDLESLNYVKKLGERINLRPTELDSLTDNLIKSSPIGYRLGGRPVAAVSRTIRQTIFRGALGLNIGSALKNLTQGVNTYSELGEKYTAKGYLQLIRKTINRSDELEKVGVLRDDFIQDRTINATRKFWEKADKGLFSLFEFAERVNRGSVYFGAKARALDKGLSEEAAIKEAVKLVEKTQFRFSNIDTPVALSSDVAKIFTQFQSFNVKQSEFLAGKIKQKDVAGLMRYIGANLVIVGTIGKLFGMDWKDMIPFSGVLTGRTKLGQTPAVQFAGQAAQAVFGDEETKAEARKDITKTARAFIPGGVQIGKSFEGGSAAIKGYTETPAGNVRYPVEQSVENKLRGILFGTQALPETREYYDQDRRPLSEGQSKAVKENPSSYQEVLSVRDLGKKADERQAAEAKQAEEIYKSIKGKSPKEQVSYLQNLEKNGQLSKNLYARVKALKEEDKYKWTNLEKQIYMLPVQEEASYHLQKMEGKTKQQKIDYLKNLEKRRLMTQDTVDAIIKISRGQNAQMP